MSPHPRYPEIEAWFRGPSAKVSPLDTVYYRITGPTYTSPSQIISGRGAFLAGGRWNQIWRRTLPSPAGCPPRLGRDPKRT